MTAPKTEWIQCIHMTAREELADFISDVVSLKTKDQPAGVECREMCEFIADAVLGMIREARQEERDACLAIIEDMKSPAAITAAERARYTAMLVSNAAFYKCRQRIRNRSRGEQE